MTPCYTTITTVTQPTKRSPPRQPTTPQPHSLDHQTHLIQRGTQNRPGCFRMRSTRMTSTGWSTSTSPRGCLFRLLGRWLQIPLPFVKCWLVPGGKGKVRTQDEEPPAGRRHCTGDLRMESGGTDPDGNPVSLSGL